MTTIQEPDVSEQLFFSSLLQAAVRVFPSLSLQLLKILEYLLALWCSKDVDWVNSLIMIPGALDVAVRKSGIYSGNIGFCAL